jgi:hypothetical protein
MRCLDGKDEVGRMKYEGGEKRKMENKKVSENRAVTETFAYQNKIAKAYQK